MLTIASHELVSTCWPAVRLRWKARTSRRPLRYIPRVVGLAIGRLSGEWVAKSVTWLTGVSQPTPPHLSGDEIATAARVAIPLESAPKVVRETAIKRGNRSTSARLRDTQTVVLRRLVRI